MLGGIRTAHAAFWSDACGAGGQVPAYQEKFSRSSTSVVHKAYRILPTWLGYA